MAIKAFVFDCGGVLLTQGDMTPYRTWEQRLGLDEGALERHLWQGDTWTRAELGQISEHEFWQRVGGELALADAGDIERLREDIWSTWVVDPQVLALIDALRSSYRLAVLSNASDALESLLHERYAVAERFETIVVSAKVGVAKPQRAIYDHLLQRLNLRAQEVMFIDDRADNVAVAASIGMHVAWFLNAAELERQIEAVLGSKQRAPDGPAETTTPNAPAITNRRGKRR